jgi:hypothetical protein
MGEEENIGFEIVFMSLLFYVERVSAIYFDENDKLMCFLF